MAAAWLQYVLLPACLWMVPAGMMDMSMPIVKVRPATQAGRFYESDPMVLGHEVDSLLSKHDGALSENPAVALIVPHAGYYFSGNVAAAAYAVLNPEHPYKRIFLLGPSHYEWLNGASVNIADDYYSTPLGKVPVDRAMGQRLMAADSVFQYQERAHDREHCIEVQLPFLQRRMRHMPPIVPVVISTNRYDDLSRMARVLREYLTPDNLFIISSDFSHYPSYMDAYEVDSRSRAAILSGDVERFIDVLQTNADSGIPRLETSACGEYAIITLMMMMDRDCDIRHLLYQNSGDIDVDGRDRVVGYHAFVVTKAKESVKKSFTLSDSDKKCLKDIARESIWAALNGKHYTVGKVPPVLRTGCGVFVTLKKNGQLRGCMGHIGEDVPLADLVSDIACSAAFEDPRFQPLRREEWPQVELELSVLTPKQRIHSIEEFQLHRHGLLIRKGYHSGTFLPQVADEVNWTREEFFGHCSQDKAGLGWNGWRDAELYTYEAIVF